MLGGCAVLWRHNERQAGSNSNDSCTGDAAPGPPPLSRSKLLGLVAGGVEAPPGGANASNGDGRWGDGLGRGVSKAGAVFGPTSNGFGVNADRPSPGGAVSELPTARSSTKPCVWAGPRRAQRL